MALHEHGVAHDTLRVWLEPGQGQSPPIAVAQLASQRYKLHQAGAHWVLGAEAPPQRSPRRPSPGRQFRASV